MTNGDRRTLGESYEKPFYKSKKFIAFLLMELLFCAMAMTALFTQPRLGWPLAAFMIGIVIVMGFIALSFNGKQAQLDTFVRAMALTGGVPTKLHNKIGKIIPPASGAAAVTPDSDLEEETP